MNLTQYYIPVYLLALYPSQNYFSNGYFFQNTLYPDYLLYLTYFSVTIPTCQELEKEPKQEQTQESQKQHSTNSKINRYAGRNDFSNMFKSFLYLVFKCKKTKAHIKSIIKTKSLPINLNVFTNKLKRKFPDSKTYIAPKEIRNFLLKLQKNKFAGQSSIGKLLKILLKGFLQENYKLYVIKKYKGKNQSKKQIFSKCRSFYEQLFGEGLQNQ